MRILTCVVLFHFMYSVVLPDFLAAAEGAKTPQVPTARAPIQRPSSPPSGLGETAKDESEETPGAGPPSISPMPPERKAPPTTEAPVQPIPSKPPIGSSVSPPIVIFVPYVIYYVPAPGQLYVQPQYSYAFQPQPITTYYFANPTNGWLSSPSLQTAHSTAVSSQFPGHIGGSPAYQFSQTYIFTPSR